MTNAEHLEFLENTKKEVEEYFSTQEIPEGFYVCFFGEFIKAFGVMPLIPDCSYLTEYDDNGNVIGCDIDNYSYKDQLEAYMLMLAGTGGWNTAFSATCNQFNKEQLLNDYNSSNWIYSDFFDTYIVEKIIESLFHGNNPQGSCLFASEKADVEDTDAEDGEQYSLFEDVKQGVNEAVEYEKGKVEAGAVTLQKGSNDV